MERLEDLELEAEAYYDGERVLASLEEWANWIQNDPEGRAWAKRARKRWVKSGYDVRLREEIDEKRLKALEAWSKWWLSKK